MTAVAHRLPFGLSRVVAPSLLGYLLITLFTFFLDLSILAIAHGVLHWPLPISVTLSYGTASLTSYALNRVLNFRSHAAVGVYFELARVIAALCEAAYLYSMMRWVVFRDTRGQVADAEDQDGGTARPAAERTAADTSRHN